MPYTPPATAFLNNTNPIGGGLGHTLDADFFNELVAGVEDADNRCTALEAGTGVNDAIARAIAKAGYVAVDTFTRSDSASLGTTESGQSWSAQVGAAAISSNKATSIADSVVVFDSGLADLDVSCLLTPVASSAASLVFRGASSGGTDRLQLVVDMTNGFRLSKVVAGVGPNALVTAPFTFTAGTTYQIRAVALDNVIVGYLNGVQRLTYVLSSAEMTALGSLTRVGLRMNTSLNPGPTWDDFRVTYAKDDSIGALPLAMQTGTSYTTTFADKYRTIGMNNASPNTVTIAPDIYPLDTALTVLQEGAGQSTFAGGAGVTVRGPNGVKTAAQYERMTATQDFANTWTVNGGTTP